MNSPRKCPQCEADLSQDAPEGLCPKLKRGNQRQVVVDGQASAIYDAIHFDPVFHPDGRLEFLARRGDELFRVTATLKPAK